MSIEIPDHIKHLYEDKNHPIVKIPNPVLRQATTPITDFSDSLQEFIDHMIYWSYHGPGIGIAAPQLGRSLKIIVVDPEYGKPEVFINPQILEEKEHIQIEEGCLSIPGIFGMVKRSRIITIEALDRYGKIIQKTYSGLGSIVFQHEIDHLNGILFIDKAIPGTLYAQDPNIKDQQNNAREENDIHSEASLSKPQEEWDT